MWVRIKVFDNIEFILCFSTNAFNPLNLQMSLVIKCDFTKSSFNNIRLKRVILVVKRGIPLVPIPRKSLYYVNWGLWINYIQMLSIIFNQAAEFS